LATSNELRGRLHDLVGDGFLRAVLQAIQEFTQVRTLGIEHGVAELIVPHIEAAQRVVIEGKALSPSPKDANGIDLGHELRPVFSRLAARPIPNGQAGLRALSTKRRLRRHRTRHKPLGHPDDNRPAIPAC
jgi:hypothetical protein